MSRGLGKLQQKILAALQPTSDAPRPSICLHDWAEKYDIRRAKYEAIRRALVGLEKRALISVCSIEELAFGIKRYALPAVAQFLDKRLAIRLDEQHAKRCAGPSAQPLSTALSVAPDGDTTLKHEAAA